MTPDRLSNIPRLAAAALTGVALLAGCGDDGGTSSQTTATEIGHRPVAPPRAPAGRTVRFRAIDGRRAEGVYSPAGSHAPALLLLHELNGGPDEWDPLVPYLHKAGFATLAIQSRDEPLEAERLPDALGALRWLRARRDVDRDRIGIVGASIGASTAVLAMATGARRTADAAVALSPPDSSDIWALQDSHRYRPHDLLLVSDERESSSAEGMLEGAIRSKTLRSANPGHGVVLLEDAHVRSALLGWLRERVA